MIAQLAALEPDPRRRSAGLSMAEKDTGKTALPMRRRPRGRLGQAPRQLGDLVTDAFQIHHDRHRHVPRRQVIQHAGESRLVAAVINRTPVWLYAPAESYARR